jgi:hypothetical protein
VAVPPVPTETFVPLIVAGPVADLGEHGVLPTWTPIMTATGAGPAFETTSIKLPEVSIVACDTDILLPDWTDAINVVLHIPTHRYNHYDAQKNSLFYGNLARHRIFLAVYLNAISQRPFPLIY